MTKRIAFFDTKSYDREVFDKVNRDFGFEIKYYKERLSMNTVSLTQDVDAVCIFVNAECDARVIERMADYGVKLVALRCAGFNNVDIMAARQHNIRVVRVPA
jgi:D-lactate dehydrogenase